MPPTVLAILAEGFEEIELVTPVDLLRRAGALVTLATLGSDRSVRGRSGLVLHADATLETAAKATYDCLFLPGGPGVRALRADGRPARLARAQAARGGWIAAICAAPVVLKDAGLLEGKQFTAHFSVASELPEAAGDQRIVADGRLLTGRGAGTALDFGLMLVAHLFSPSVAAGISREVAADLPPLPCAESPA
ncbi:MAG TPA: DJ-1 family glyoxalase III [Opitutaceae bacterium]|jgi:4-methyl-5(b-hydroxyethyl)-thiazole monophosphate biosynthesis